MPIIPSPADRLNEKTSGRGVGTLTGRFKNRRGSPALTPQVPSTPNMIRHLFAAAALAGLAVLVSAGGASAAAEVQRPPPVLSPDVNDPWLLQLKPGKKRPVLSYPRTTRAFLFGPPVTQSPLRLQPGTRPPPTLLAIPGAAQPPGAKYRNRQIDPGFLPQVVAYPSGEKPGTIVIDTNNRHLYLVMGDGRALRYGVGVGRPGFEWAGVHRVSRKAEWPDWTPPAEMLRRRPELPRYMAGGPDNPLGARALYLGSTLYRIHGSNEPWTIGHAVSSGCIRMRNEDVTDLYERVGVGTKVIVI